MIGMPRITLIRPPLSLDSTRTPETRISAQNSPRIVDRTSEPTVTRIVSHTPCNRIGKNSVASRRKFCIDSNHALHLARPGLNHNRALLVYESSGFEEGRYGIRPIMRQAPCALSPHLSRILSTLPFTLSLTSEALIFISKSWSHFRTPMAN